MVVICIEAVSARCVSRFKVTYGCLMSKLRRDRRVPEVVNTVVTSGVKGRITTQEGQRLTPGVTSDLFVTFTMTPALTSREETSLI